MLNMDFSPEMECFLMKYPRLSNFDGITSEIISNLLLGKFRNNLDGTFCNDLLLPVKLNHSFEDDLKEEIGKQIGGFDEVQAGLLSPFYLLAYVGHGLAVALLVTAFESQVLPDPSRYGLSMALAPVTVVELEQIIQQLPAKTKGPKLTLIRKPNQCVNVASKEMFKTYSAFS